MQKITVQGSLLRFAIFIFISYLKKVWIKEAMGNLAGWNNHWEKLYNCIKKMHNACYANAMLLAYVIIFLYDMKMVNFILVYLDSR